MKKKKKKKKDLCNINAYRVVLIVQSTGLFFLKLGAIYAHHAAEKFLRDASISYNNSNSNNKLKKKTKQRLSHDKGRVLWFTVTNPPDRDLLRRAVIIL